MTTNTMKDTNNNSDNKNLVERESQSHSLPRPHPLHLNESTHHQHPYKANSQIREGSPAHETSNADLFKASSLVELKERKTTNGQSQEQSLYRGFSKLNSTPEQEEQETQRNLNLSSPQSREQSQQPSQIHHRQEDLQQQPQSARSTTTAFPVHTVQTSEPFHPLANSPLHTAGLSMDAYFSQSGQTAPPRGSLVNVPSTGHTPMVRYSITHSGTNDRISSGARHRKEIKRRTKTGCLTCRKRRIKVS